MFHTVYKITNLINQKIYIGAHSTTDINDDYMGSGNAILNAIKKHGLENFRKEIIFVYDTSEEMYSKEKEIVTEEFCNRDDNYNIRIGGIGGFNHYNGTDKHKRSAREGGIAAAKKTNEFVKQQRENNTEWWQKRKKQITEQNNKRKGLGICNGWKNYTESERISRRQLISKNQTGTGNSQYGKIWISHPETKEVQRIHQTDIIPDGWVRGKKGHVPTRIWVNNGITQHYIFIEKLDNFLSSGYIKGQIKKHLTKLK